MDFTAVFLLKMCEFYFRRFRLFATGHLLSTHHGGRHSKKEYLVRVHHYIHNQKMYKHSKNESNIWPGSHPTATPSSYWKRALMNIHSDHCTLNSLQLSLLNDLLNEDSIIQTQYPSMHRVINVSTNTRLSVLDIFNSILDMLLCCVWLSGIQSLVVHGQLRCH